MPRLSPAVRDARRQQIARAALTCIARDGVAGTSMADIIKESGLSSGSIYSHFDGKADLLQYAAQAVLEQHENVAGESTDGAPGPTALARHIVTAIVRTAPQPVLMQVWAEVARDPELAALPATVLPRIHALQVTALTPWARSHRPDDESAERLASRTADAVIGAVHAYVVRTSLDPGVDPETLLLTLTAGLDGLAEALSDPLHG